jgi:hypothetical protein
LSRWKLAAWLRAVPPEAILLGVGLFVVLAAFISADAAAGVSTSSGAQGDEFYNVVSARDFVLLGTWATDQWDHHLVNLPFSVVSAAVFRVFGIGIDQARLMTALFISLTAAALVWGLRPVVGRPAALFAGLSFATSGLILYYGRLAFLEDLVVLAMTLGVLVLARPGLLSVRGGIVSGACLAVAIGTKPSALFAVTGVLAATAVILAWRDAAMRRWLVGAVTTIAVAGLAWVLIIFLPNRDAVITDVKIWMPGHFYITPAELARSIGSYLRGGNDGLYGMLLGPLIVLSAAGVVAIAVLRRHLSEAETRLAVAALGWAVFGFGILVVTSYRPNRYVVPLVPALSILATIGLRLALASLRERIDSATASPATGRRFIPQAVAVVLVVFVAAPGLAWYARWIPNRTFEIQTIDSQFAGLDLPADAPLAGNNAAQFLFTTQNPLIVTGIANNDDLYTTGVRWYLASTDDPPPRGVPAAAWADRRQTICVKWRQLKLQCLYEVP